MKAKGEVQTNARFMRDFVMDHPQYNEDSIVTENIQFDLLKQIHGMVDTRAGEKLLNILKSKTK